jgi:hypothetical protein
MSRVYGGVVSSVRTLDATTINNTGNLNFPLGGDILGAGLIECNIISANNISGDLNPVNETLTNTTLSGFTNIIGGNINFLSPNSISGCSAIDVGTITGVHTFNSTGDISSDGFLRVGGDIVGDSSGSVAGTFYATDVIASAFMSASTITTGTLNYTTLNPPFSASLGLGQILQTSNDASGFDISNVGDIIAHTNADFHLRNDSVDGDLLLQTVRNLDISCGNAMNINGTGIVVDSNEFDCTSNDVVFTNNSFNLTTISGIVISSDLAQPATGVLIEADPLVSFGLVEIKAGQPGGKITLNASKIDCPATGSRLDCAVIAGYELRSTEVDNAGDFNNSSTHMNEIVLQGGYRNDLNWLYFIGRSDVNVTVAFGRIALSKAYFFTGQHPCFIPTYDLSGEHYGLILSSNVDAKGYIQPPVVNDSHIVAKVCDTPNDKNVYGVLSYYDFIHQAGYSALVPTENPDGKIYYSNSTGEGMMYVCDLAGSIQSGDYITSGDIPGMGVLQDDDLLHNYTLAKSTQTVDFNTHYYSYWRYDDPTNPERTPDQIHKAVAEKYKVLYGRIYVGAYVVYTTPERRVEDEYMTLQYDFTTKKPHLVGRDFKCALVGVVYQN